MTLVGIYVGESNHSFGFLRLCVAWISQPSAVVSTWRGGFRNHPQYGTRVVFLGNSTSCGAKRGAAGHVGDARLLPDKNSSMRLFRGKIILVVNKQFGYFSQSTQEVKIP